MPLAHGFRRARPGGATTGPLQHRTRASTASVGLAPAGPQLVRYTTAQEHPRLPSGSPRRGHNWSATPRHRSIHGFRRARPGGATTGPLQHRTGASTASVGLAPAGPQLVRYSIAQERARLPSGSPRRGHNWSATPRHRSIHGFRRARPGGATTGPLQHRTGASTASVGLAPAGPQLVRYSIIRTHVEVSISNSGSERRKIRGFVPSR